MNRQETGLYCPQLEHDSCGIGAVVDIHGRKTHKTVDDALSIVEKLEHRAGQDASGKTGDGVGILIQIPHAYFIEAVPELQRKNPGMCEYGVGMFFYPKERLARIRSQRLFETIAARSGMDIICWRDVPTRPEILSPLAADSMPYICQCFIAAPTTGMPAVDFDRRLYILRREFEQSAPDTYVCSLSCRTIVYKGMLLVSQLRRFFPELDDKRCTSALALVHSRFSTNTQPSWERAHPNRLLCHNGEINTIRGNIDRMIAREETMASPLLDDSLKKLMPVVCPGGSDSAALDNTLEFLMFCGMELPKAAMVTVPEPWKRRSDLSRAKRDMYHYYATMMEPWDGPAALLFSDGELVGAALDRNGLRPMRVYETNDGYLIISSEVGVLDIPPENIKKRSRIAPGGMLVADLTGGCIYDDDQIKSAYASQYPYGEWLDRELVHLSSLPVPMGRSPEFTCEQRTQQCLAFGYHYEDLKDTILPMATMGIEPTAAMGADIPLAVLSENHQPLFRYFRQQFAQVTNPPIDAIREEIVTDTTVYAGSDGNLLEDKAENCHVLQIESPILTGSDMMKIRTLDMPGLKSGTVSLLYYKYTSLEKALEQLFVDCDKAWRRGCTIIILSDRGVDENHMAIPSLLAVSAVEQYLIRTKKRTAVSVILESGEPRSAHDFAVLLGYGARAVHPYLAHNCITGLIDDGLLDRDAHFAIEQYNSAVVHGIVKIASKMGISSLQSYQSAQIFEALGICRNVIDKYFTNTLSRVGGIGLEEIGQAVLFNHNKAFDPLALPTELSLSSSGMHKLRSGKGAEDHMYCPSTILSLQKAVQKGSYEDFCKYSALVDDEALPHTLRGLLEFTFDSTSPISLDEVESVDSIVKRFKTGAMSYGSISQEAHECLAEAMNILGGKSNSGEGGEDPQRLGTNKGSAIKQVASGRFGVTSEYLVSAKEIQIKMAQGAKPGEGGHLPGSKVWPWIAKTRLSTPGVALISPPPHHDIYSIEDLAQLIFDLKCANPSANISVKLVSEAGVGTIASGVAKAGAGTILISGSDGGTGAAPESSIHNAGMPWELGLAEAHQTLIKNGLRHMVRLEADGKLMTGRDVAIACMLGAEEFGFASAPLVSMGCMMMRVCNLDTCPVGIATQDPALRKNFKGKPEYVVNFMRFVAQQLREIMAKLGVCTVDELVGHTEYLRVKKKQITHRAQMVDLSALLVQGTAPCDKGPQSGVACFDPAAKLVPQDLDRLLSCETAPCFKISCTNRAFGTLLGSEITKRFGSSLAPNTIHIKAIGGAGQSFGAFIPQGLSLELQGDANDYLGKGLSGGCIAVYPPKGCREDDIIIGNVALYGATSGEAYICGRAGERFAVRNSGAWSVVEGVGDHGCEYMTGGRIAVLGPTGRNFAAGMSGGMAYVLDREHDLYRRVNKELVAIEPISEPNHKKELHDMLCAHLKATGSVCAGELLDDFDAQICNFKLVVPRAYSAMLKRIAEYESAGLSRSSAELKAFMEGRK